jgi:uncharacterized membrane protein HdeD (DUF308 family)
MSPDVPAPADINPLDPAPTPAETVRENWGWFLALGLVQILAGVAALVLTVAATLLAILVMGGLALAAAAVELAGVFWARSWAEGLARVLVGLLYGLFGVVVLANPGLAATTLTLVLAILLVVNGVTRIVLALAGRHRGWAWGLVGGVVSVGLGFVVWANWPWDSLWVIGLFVGIDLLLMGWTWVAVALAVRGAREPRAAAALGAA